MRIDVLAALALAGIVVGGLAYGKDFVITSIMMSAFYVLAVKTYGERLLAQVIRVESYRKKNAGRFFVFLSLAAIPVLLLAARVMAAHKAPGDNVYVAALAFGGLLSGMAGIIFLLRNQPAESK